MCFVCDVILCKSCACATTRSRTRCTTSKFRKHAWNRRETGEMEKNPHGAELQVAEGSLTNIGGNKIINTVKQMNSSIYNDVAAVLGEKDILKDNNVQPRIDSVFHRSLTEMSEYDGVPEVVEENIEEVDKTQLNMSQVLDCSLLGRSMY